MSQENVEIAWNACQAWAAGDFESTFAAMDPDVVWDATRFEGWMEKPIYCGRDEVRGFLEEWLGTWDRFEAGVEEVRDAGDRVVVFWWQRMSGGGSGVPVELRSAQVWRFSSGGIARIDNYTDRAKALEAAGLAE
jgi:ketosteroid isomerase-like protein